MRTIFNAFAVINFEKIFAIVCSNFSKIVLPRNDQVMSWGSKRVFFLNSSIK